MHNFIHFGHLKFENSLDNFSESASNTDYTFNIFKNLGVIHVKIRIKPIQIDRARPSFALHGIPLKMDLAHHLKQKYGGFGQKKASME